MKMELISLNFHISELSDIQLVLLLLFFFPDYISKITMFYLTTK